MPAAAEAVLRVEAEVKNVCETVIGDLQDGKNKNWNMRWHSFDKLFLSSIPWIENNILMLHLGSSIILLGNFWCVRCATSKLEQEELCKQQQLPTQFFVQVLLCFPSKLFDGPLKLLLLPPKQHRRQRSSTMMWWATTTFIADDARGTHARSVGRRAMHSYVYALIVASTFQVFFSTASFLSLVHPWLFNNPCFKLDGVNDMSWHFLCLKVEKSWPLHF